MCAVVLRYCMTCSSTKASTPPLWRPAGNPVVYGEIEGERDDVTVVLYNHYDVKPVEPLEAWHSEPFRPLFRRGRVEDQAPVVPDWRALSPAELRSCLVYARGSGDDKGPLHGNLMALRTMRCGGRQTALPHQISL